MPVGSNAQADTYRPHPWSPVFSTRRSVLWQADQLGTSTVWDRQLSQGITSYTDGLILDPTNRTWMKRLHHLILFIDARKDITTWHKSHHEYHMQDWGEPHRELPLEKIFERFKGAGSELLIADMHERIRNAASINGHGAGCEEPALAMEIYTVKGQGNPVWHDHRYPVIGTAYAGEGPHIAADGDDTLFTVLQRGQVCNILQGKQHRSPPYEEGQTPENCDELRLYIGIYRRYSPPASRI